MRRPSRSATASMPCGLPRATTKPCSRRQRCTSSTGAPAESPASYRVVPADRWLRSSKCRVTASAAPRDSWTMPLTLPRGPGTTETASPAARSRRSSAGSSLPPSAERLFVCAPAGSTRAAADRDYEPRSGASGQDTGVAKRRVRSARRSPPSTRPHGRASARRAVDSPSDHRPAAISFARCAASEAEPICTGTARYRRTLYTRVVVIGARPISVSTPSRPCVPLPACANRGRCRGSGRRSCSPCSWRSGSVGHASIEAGADDLNAILG